MELALALGIVLVASGLGAWSGLAGVRRAGMVKPGEPMPRRVWVMTGALTLYGCGIVTLGLSAGMVVASAVAVGVVLLLQLAMFPVYIRNYRRVARRAREQREARRRPPHA